MPAAKLARIAHDDPQPRRHAEDAVGRESHSDPDDRACWICRSTTSTRTASSNVEFQHGHLAKDTTNPDPAFFKEMKAKLDAAGSRANQINIEIGTMAQLGPDGKAAALAGDARATWLATGKKWVDVAPMLGIKRLMLNQGALTDDSKAGVISLWKELQDYARPKGIMISNETRGTGVPTAGGRGGPGQAAAPAPPPPPSPAGA